VTVAALLIGAAAACGKSSPAAPTPMPSPTSTLVGLASSSCLTPFTIPDKWTENFPAPGPWSSTSTFDRYWVSGQAIGTLLLNPDVYDRGFTIADDGMRFKLTSQTSTLLLAGGFFVLQIPRTDGSGAGGLAAQENVAGCNGVAMAVGSNLTVAVGNLVGPITTGASMLIAKDPTATWNEATRSVQNSCAPGCAPASPRIITLSVYNPDEMQLTLIRTGDLRTVNVVKIVQFFVSSVVGNATFDGFLIVKAR
jgi:hypothetical protein